MVPVFEWRNTAISSDGTTILTNFSLTVRKGEKVVLFGPSGTGKTSILRSALGFISLTEGDFFFNGQGISKKLFWDLRKKIAYIPQDPDIGEGAVQGLIDTVFNLKANGPIPDSNAVKDLLDLFELPYALLEKNFEQLSGGEKQRVGIVIAVLLKRDIFFLDEITAALDGSLKEKVIRYFVSRNDDAAQLIVSHDAGWRNQPGVRYIDILPYSVPEIEGAET